MTVQKGFFENYRGGHDVWADMTTENTVLGEYGNKYYKTNQFDIINDYILFSIQRINWVNNIRNKSVINII